MRVLLRATPPPCAALVRARAAPRAAAAAPRAAACCARPQCAIVASLPPRRAPRAARAAPPRCEVGTAPQHAAPARTKNRRRLATALHAAEALLFLGLVAFSAILPPLLCLEWWALLRISEAVAAVAAAAVPLAFAPALVLRAVVAARRMALARAFAKQDGHLAARKAALAALSRRAAEASAAAPAAAYAACITLAAAAGSAAVLRAAGGASQWAPPLAVAALAAVVAFWPLRTPPLWLSDPFAARELRLAAALEHEAYAALHRGTHHCAWRPDLYPAASKAASAAKAQTNALFAAAVADALRDAGTPPRAAHALILDAATGLSAAALERGAGLRRSRIFSPNTATPSVAALRAPAVGVRAFCADVGALLRRRPAAWDPYDAVWLDYCGGLGGGRGDDVAALFGAHALAPGGVLGLGFSHRDAGAALAARGGLRADAHAERLVCREAARRGYAARRVARHDYDGMCFLAFRVDLAEHGIEEGGGKTDDDGFDSGAVGTTWGADGGA